MDTNQINALIVSRLQILWNQALMGGWPAKYRHCLEACLHHEEDFDRDCIERSLEVDDEG
jgi:hypothetical protein